MTQKEYKERIKELIEENNKLHKELEEEKEKNYDYLQVLKDYHIVSKLLADEKGYNDLNNEKIREQEQIIEKYQKIIDKFTINF